MAGWDRAPPIGAAPCWRRWSARLLLNATLPLEIDLMFRAIGRPLALSWLGLYLMALLVAGSISALIAALRAPRAVPAASPGARTVTSGAARRPARSGWRADGFRRRSLPASRAGRWSAPAGAVPPQRRACPNWAAHDGLQVHRSAWVARRHVAGARRDGRRWLLVLADGSEQAVSETHMPAVRAAGWLQTKL